MRTLLILFGELLYGALGDLIQAERGNLKVIVFENNAQFSEEEKFNAPGTDANVHVNHITMAHAPVDVIPKGEMTLTKFAFAPLTPLNLRLHPRGSEFLDRAHELTTEPTTRRLAAAKDPSQSAFIKALLDNFVATARGDTYDDDLNAYDLMKSPAAMLEGFQSPIPPLPGASRKLEELLVIGRILEVDYYGLTSNITGCHNPLQCAMSYILTYLANRKAPTSFYSLVAEIVLKSPGEHKFVVTGKCSDSGWKLFVKVKSLYSVEMGKFRIAGRKPVTLSAEVRQNCGFDWKDAEMTLTTAATNPFYPVDSTLWTLSYTQTCPVNPPPFPGALMSKAGGDSAAAREAGVATQFVVQNASVPSGDIDYFSLGSVAVSPTESNNFVKFDSTQAMHVANLKIIDDTVIPGNFGQWLIYDGPKLVNELYVGTTVGKARSAPIAFAVNQDIRVTLQKYPSVNVADKNGTSMTTYRVKYGLRYVAREGGPAAVVVFVVIPVPVSKDADIKVALNHDCVVNREADNEVVLAEGPSFEGKCVRLTKTSNVVYSIRLVDNRPQDLDHVVTVQWSNTNGRQLYNSYPVIEG